MCKCLELSLNFSINRNKNMLQIKLLNNFPNLSCNPFSLLTKLFVCKLVLNCK